MKITHAEYISGQPALDNIHINLSHGVTLTLSKEQYAELSEAVSEENNTLIKQILETDHRFDKKRKAYVEAVKDIRNLFYEPFGDALMRKSVDEIDDQDLIRILDKHADFLGLE